MKKHIIFLFLLCSLFAQAQTVEYSIYAPAPDSFFLVETVTGVASKDAPKPGKTETSQLFRSEAQLLDYIQYLKSQSALAIKQADDAIKEAETKAKTLREAAPRIKTAADKIEAVAVKNRDVLRGKKVEEKPTVKPKKKKKQ